MSQGIMLVTKDLQVPVINGRCAELLGLPEALIQNTPRFDQLAEYQARNGQLREGPDLFEGALEETTSGQLATFERSMPDGTVVEIHRGRLPDGGFVQTFMDITKRSQAEAHVARLASEDPLTGLSNRRVFRSELDQIIERQSPATADGPHATEFAVLFLDLDRFKFVNDTLGHRVGDLLLQAVAKRLRETLRPNDLLARLSGDEFAVVMPSVESRAAVEAMAKRLIAAVVEPYEISGYQVRSSISIGIAIGLQDGKTTDDLLMAADLALYATKGNHRGTYQFHQSSMNKALNDRRQIEMDLREAIERNELKLYYQPIIDLRRKVVCGFEALARWQHPTKGMVPPSEFIPVAEDSGLILPLGEWALREACRNAAQWPDDLKVAVNLSPIQLLAPDIAETIIRILSETGMAPHRLELEITERIFMEDSETTVSILRRLKAFGIRIAMDDFGTGYSSLSYLRSFPFDRIKVDRTFVSDLAARNDYAVIVQAVVSIARAHGMSTTAEGVETAAQHEFLAALGCDEAQGYLFGRPLPIEKISEFLASWTAEKTLAA
jgi:diguanylate cyclase (GGDEF)-like protein